ncbi:xylose isomerase [Pseudarthrobacter sulfonivorans]|uniref:Xylose isomerase n=1 Tax=Pseudarthrobacter sulfonivorans TaxID=121292 RepID=A0A0U3GXM9_9MICC|nr:xylose isomerase [Pseudarthrobacter sulfonivorans]
MTPEPWILTGFGDEIHTDPRIQIAVLKALGAKHIEIRSAWGTNILDLSEPQLHELRSLMDTNGINVSAVASPIGKVEIELPVEHEVDRLRTAIRAADILKAKFIRIFSFHCGAATGEASIRDAVMERMTALATLAEDAGVVLLHENEKDIYGDNPARILDIMETVDSPALKVAWDPANFVQVGISPFDEAYALLRPHVAYLQIKDARASDKVVVPAGEGDGDIPRTISALKADGYSGFISVEPHLASAHLLGGFSGPAAFGDATRALTSILADAGVQTA